MNQLHEERSELMWQMTKSLFDRQWSSESGLEYSENTYWISINNSLSICLDIEFRPGASIYSRLILTTGCKGGFGDTEAEYDFKVSDTLTCEAITNIVTTMLSVIN